MACQLSQGIDELQKVTQCLASKIADIMKNGNDQQQAQPPCCHPPQYFQPIEPCMPTRCEPCCRSCCCLPPPFPFPCDPCPPAPRAPVILPVCPPCCPPPCCPPVISCPAEDLCPPRRFPKKCCCAKEKCCCASPRCGQIRCCGDSCCCCSQPNANYLQLLEVHPTGRYVKIFNTSYCKAESLSNCFLVQMRGSCTISLFKFPKRSSMPPQWLVKVWCCSSDPGWLKMPADFVFKELYRFSVGSDITTVLYDPFGTAISWITGCERYTVDNCCTCTPCGPQTTLRFKPTY